MKVVELMERLRECQQDARVVVQGYEAGYDDISIIEEIDIQPASDQKWYYGRYEKAEPEMLRQSEQVVLLFGRGRGDDT